MIILDNSITGMTGHQQNPTTGFNLKGDPCTKIDLESLCRSVGIRRVRVVDPYDLAQCDAAVKEELAADEPSVIIARRPCALLKYVKHKQAPGGGCGQVQELQNVHEDRLSGHFHDQRQSGALTTPSAPAAAYANSFANSTLCTRPRKDVNMETKNIMIVGVGGQGSLLACQAAGPPAADQGL